MKKTTLIGFSVFAALLVGTVVVLNKKPERGIARLDASANKDDVVKISIGGKNAVELTKEGETWKLTSGRLADDAAVKRLLDTLSKLKSSDLIKADDKKLSELELDEEKGTPFAVYGKGNKKLSELVIGKASGASLMVKRADEVYRINGVSASIFNKPVSAWIEKKLFTQKAEDVTSVAVKLAGATPYTVVKTDNVWGFQDASVVPAGFRFDADAARSLASALVGLRVKEYVEEAVAADITGLGEGADEVSASLKAEGEAAPTTLTVRLGKTKDGTKDLYAQVVGKPDLFLITEMSAKNLKKAALDLRDLKLVKVEREKIKKLLVVDGKNSVALEKKEGGWTLGKASEPTPADFTFDPAAVERRIGMFVNAKAQKLVTEKGTSGLSAPTAKLVATLEDGSTVTLAFGKDTKEDDKEMVYAQGNADNEVYLVNKYTRQNLTGGLATFKKMPEQPGMGGLGGLDPAALSSLPPEIRENFMKQMRDQQKQQELLKRIQAPPPAKAQ